MRTRKYLTIVFLSLLLGASARAQMSAWLEPFFSRPPPIFEEPS